MVASINTHHVIILHLAPRKAMGTIHNCGLIADETTASIRVGGSGSLLCLVTDLHIIVWIGFGSGDFRLRHSDLRHRVSLTRVVTGQERKEFAEVNAYQT